jgi:toxin YoeB
MTKLVPTESTPMPFTLELRKRAAEEYAWARGNWPNIAKKIDELLEALTADPFKGIGKPEPLKWELHGFWSRRVTREHRMVYQVKGSKVSVVRCLEHYG